MYPKINTHKRDFQYAAFLNEHNFLLFRQSDDLKFQLTLECVGVYLKLEMFGKIRLEINKLKKGL